MSRDSGKGQRRYVGWLTAGLMLPSVAGASTTEMVARHSLKCVDVPNAASQSGVGLQQFTCNGSKAQRFTFTTPGDGFHRISSGANASLCLDAGTALNGQVTQTTCSATDSQKWLVSPRTDGSYQVKTRDGASCLNIAGGLSNVADGASLITWACSSDANMLFNLPGFVPSLPYTGRATTLVASHSDKCLNVSGASTASGAGLVQWACGSGASQQSFSLVGTADGFYQLKPQVSGLCLDAGSAADGTQVLQKTCGTGSSQKWKVQRNADGSFFLATANGVSCLDIPSKATTDGAVAAVGKCSTGSASQSFYAPGLIAVSAPPNGDPNAPPAKVTANGNFQLHAGRIYDPNGNMFVPMGMNIWPDQSASFDNIVNCWKSNIVRLNHVRFDYGGWYNQWKLEDTLNHYANRGIVAMVEWHEIGQIGDEPSGWNHEGTWPYASGQAHTDAIKNFYVGLAQKFKNNPYVWFNLINEPGGPPYEAGHEYDPAYSTVPRWVKVNRQIIQAIRATGARNMIVLDGMTWGQDSRDGSAERVTESDSAILRGGPEAMVDANGRPFGNVMFSVHTYSVWRNNPGPRLEQYFKDVRAKGMALMVGEYNHLAMEVSKAMIPVAHRQGVGRLVWHHNSGDTQLTTGGSAGSINSCTSPTNLNELGQLTWSDMHR